MKKRQNIINKLYSLIFLIILVLIWQALLTFKIVDSFLLPSPTAVILALIKDIKLLLAYSVYTITEGFLGLFISIAASFLLAIFMERYSILHKAIYPTLIISQTVPVVAIAPLLVLWLGYGMLPKIALVAITCFFPLTVGIFDGLRSADTDMLDLLKAMGADKNQLLWHIKLPYSMTNFFAGLKIAVSYSIVGAVISEWIGGTVGLGVYMIRVKKSFEFDKMFAVILLIVIISLILIKITNLIEKKFKITER